MAWSSPRTWANAEIVTQTMLNTDVRDNMRELWHELAYVEFTADVTVATTTTEAAPIDVVSSGAITYAAIPIVVEFFTPGVLCGGSSGVTLSLWDGATDLGRWGMWTVGGSSSPGPLARRLSPSAASHTYKVRAWASPATNAGTVNAGVGGGTGVEVPGYIRVLQKGG